MTVAAKPAVPPPPHAIEVGAEALPVSCPGPNAPAWSMHPRVFLDVTRVGTASCPYCGATYKLKAGTIVQSH